MKPFGLGDLAYYAFRPFVYFTDLVWGTDLRMCEVCKDRRAKWNKAFSLHPLLWLLVVVLIAIIIF